MSNLPPIQISLVAGGVSEIAQAFKSIEDRARKMEQTLANLQVAGENKRTNEAKRGGNARISQADKNLNALRRETEKWTRDAVNAEKKKNALIEADAKRSHAKLEAETKRSAQARNNFFSKVASNTVGTMQRTIGTAMRMAGMVAAVGGGFSIADSLGSEVKNNGKAKEVSLNSGGVLSKGQILNHAKAIATTQGMTTDDALGGIDQFLAKTGDAKMAVDALKDIGDMANATGADFKELSTMAGLAWNSLDPKTRTKDDLTKVMRIAVAQGRAGAMDVREFAQYGTRIFNSAAQFKGGTLGNSEYIGALAQTAMERGTATDSAEATESVKSLGLDVMTHQKQLNAAGIKGTVDSYGNLNSAQTVTEKLLLGTHGDVGKLEHVGIERRSIKALEGDAMIFRKVLEEQTKAGKDRVTAEEAALEAVRDAHKKYIGIQYDAADVQREASERVAETDKKLAMAFEKLKNTVGEALLPELIKLIPVIEQLTPGLVALLKVVMSTADWLLKNPLEGTFAVLGTIMVASLTKALMLEGITALVAATGPVGIAMAGFVAALGVMTAAITIANKAEEEKQKLKGKTAAGADVAEVKEIESNITDLEKLQSNFETNSPENQKLLETSRQQLADKLAEIKKKATDAEDRANHANTLQERFDKFGGPTGLESLGITNSNAGPFGSLNSDEMTELNDRARNDPKGAIADSEYVKGVNKLKLNLAEDSLRELRLLNVAVRDLVEERNNTKPTKLGTDGSN